MHLGFSKYWWAYLALRSNPTLLISLEPASEVVLFDNVAHLAGRNPADYGPRFCVLCILWDGVADAPTVRLLQRWAAQGVRTGLLTVGLPVVSDYGGLRASSLYCEGPQDFTAGHPRFHARTLARIAASKGRNLLMPLKNLRQPAGGFLAAIALLRGRCRVVFCGSYGLNPKVLHELCKRHHVAPSNFEDYPFLTGAEDSSDPGTYAAHLCRGGQFLARHLDNQTIPEAFFFSALHLLGRQFHLRQIELAHLPAFVNGYDTGANVNLYTTPWYRQHVFVDFGSAVGPGNYPRLADLRYYKKCTVEIEAVPRTAAARTAARDGMLDTLFLHQWQTHAPRLFEAFGRQDAAQRNGRSSPASR